jgi:hypothetical protein
VFAFASLVWAFPVLAYAAWCSVVYPSPRAATIFAMVHEDGRVFVVREICASEVFSKLEPGVDLIRRTFGAEESIGIGPSAVRPLLRGQAGTSTFVE